MTVYKWLGPAHVLEHDGKTFKRGEEVDLSDEQHQFLVNIGFQFAQPPEEGQSEGEGEGEAAPAAAPAEPQPEAAAPNEVEGEPQKDPTQGNAQTEIPEAKVQEQSQGEPQKDPQQGHPQTEVPESAAQEKMIAEQTGPARNDEPSKQGQATGVAGDEGSTPTSQSRSSRTRTP